MPVQPTLWDSHRFYLCGRQLVGTQQVQAWRRVGRRVCLGTLSCSNPALEELVLVRQRRKLFIVTRLPQIVYSLVRVLREEGRVEHEVCMCVCVGG